MPLSPEQTCALALCAEQGSGDCGGFALLWLLCAILVVAYRYKKSAKARNLQSRCKAWFAHGKALASRAHGPVAWDEWIEKGESLAEACDVIPQLTIVADEIRASLLPYRSAKALAAMQSGNGMSNSTEEIAGLCRLRASGLITDAEFARLTERFERSSGTKAGDILDSIEKLHAQHRDGAMSRGNYHAALWILLDRLERDLK